VRRLPRDDVAVPLEELERDVAGRRRRDRLGEGLERLAEGREPLAEVDQLGVAGRDPLLLVRRLAVERERLERLERLDEQRPARRLVDAARLDADEPVLDDVGAADAVPPGDRVEPLDERGRRKLDAVDRDGKARLERDRDLLRDVGRVLRARRELEHRLDRLERRIFERAALVREVPEVPVARVRILFRHRHRNAARGRVVDRVLARDDVPLAPRRDDAELGRERLVSELEADLVVPLAGAAVREAVAAGGESDLDLLARDERPCRRSSEQVVVLVHGSRAQDGKEILRSELLDRVDEIELLRAGLVRLLFEMRRLFRLAYVDRDRDDFAAVVLAEPGDDHRGVEAAGVGESDFPEGLFHGVVSFDQN